MGEVEIVEAGVYAFNFNVAGTEPNQMTLYLDETPIPGATYASGAGTQPNPGFGIFVAPAGSTVTLRNHTSAEAVTLATPIGGTAANTNASLQLLKIAPTPA